MKSESIEQDSPVLLFVYNADSGFLNMLKDAVHKTVSPRTYPCKLCDITYSPVKMRSQWKRFVQTLPFEVQFTYKDLIDTQHDKNVNSHPSAWIQNGKQLEPLLDASQLNACDDLESLQKLVLEAIVGYQSRGGNQQQDALSGNS